MIMAPLSLFYISAEITFTPNNYVVSENDQSVKVTVTRKGNNGGKNTCT